MMDFGDTMKKTVYNEDVYLNGDKDALLYFANKYNTLQKQIDEEIYHYTELIDAYDLYIEYLAEFLASLKLKNAIEYSLALSYLIDKGVISISGTFKHQEAKYELLSRFGISIITGVGCCRNVAAMHRDVFQQLDLYIKPFYCAEGENVFNRLKNNPADHVINLIQDNDTLYGMDLFNKERLYKFKDTFTMESISTYSKSYLLYKPYYELITGESSIEDIQTTLTSFALESQKPHINPLQYSDEIKYPIKSFMDSKTSEMETFKTRNKILTRYIYDQITR